MPSNTAHDKALAVGARLAMLGAARLALLVAATAAADQAQLGSVDQAQLESAKLVREAWQRKRATQWWE